MGGSSAGAGLSFQERRSATLLPLPTVGGPLFHLRRSPYPSIPNIPDSTPSRDTYACDARPRPCVACTSPRRRSQRDASLTEAPGTKITDHRTGPLGLQEQRCFFHSQGMLPTPPGHAFVQSVTMLTNNAQRNVGKLKSRCVTAPASVRNWPKFHLTANRSCCKVPRQNERLPGGRPWSAISGSTRSSG
jgi:hypothetical protein